MNVISSSGDTWRTRHFRRVDRLLWMPAIAHYAFNLIVAFFTDTLALTLIVGLVAFPPLLLLYWRRSDSRFNAYGKAVLYMALSALLIEQSGGLIEAHFSIFIMLAVLILYADWRVILVGASTIAVHHLLFTFLQYHGLVQLYRLTLGGPHGSQHGLGELIACLLMHAGAVVAEAAVLSYLALVLKSMIKDGESVARFAAEAGDGRLDHAFERKELARPMVATVHAMRERIAETLQQASATAEEVSELSVALVAGGDELRAQVESNVSQVEAISSVATQFSATTQEYAQEASTVRGLAEAAAGHARRGSRTMEALEASMTVIRRDTQGIVALLGDIDQITFQTNLLALNASVEAARAGEQGRGFAVVAGEVRTLASRTQEVAQQIRGSIGEMAESVEAGVESSGSVSEAMRDVIQTFEQVVERLHDIDITSQEQQRGIEDLEQSVQKFHTSLGVSARQLDENHAMARRLSDSAEALMAAVGKFRLPDRQVAGTRTLLPEPLS